MKGGYQLGGEHYKRVPRGYDLEHPHAELLRYSCLTAADPGRILFGCVSRLQLPKIRRDVPHPALAVRAAAGAARKLGYS